MTNNKLAYIVLWVLVIIAAFAIIFIDINKGTNIAKIVFKSWVLPSILMYVSLVIIH